MLSFPIRLTEEEDGTFLATSPDFPELTTFGEDREDALLHAVDALEEAIAARIAHREEIPTPSKGRHQVVLPTQTAMKVQLYRLAKAQGVTKAELARRLHWHGPQVDRLFDLNHASRMDQIDAAMSALGARVTVSLKEMERVEP